MGTAFLYGNGGGIDNLKFRVYSATSMPSSGKENDVCIITSTPIFFWEAGAIDNPTWSIDDGFVYLTCDASDASQPNLLRKNALYLKLMRCWQYEKGTWSTKDAYQYRNGAWVQFSTDFTATINVTYPAGSTCTATDGVTTLTAPDTSGTWDCVVPNAGTWTIAVGGYLPVIVSVSTEGQIVSVDLTKLYLFKDGDEFVSITGGWEAKVNVDYKGTLKNDGTLLSLVGVGTYSSAIAGIKNTSNLDLSGYSNAIIKVTNASGNCEFGILKTYNFTDFSTEWAAKKAISGAGEFSLDISSVSSGVPLIKVLDSELKLSEFRLEV